MEVLEISHDTYIIKYLDKIYKLEIDNNEGILYIKENDSYKLLEKGFKGTNKEILEKALKYLELTQNVIFNHDKGTWWEALSVSNDDINKILKEIYNSIESTSCISESIEYLYNKYKNNTNKLIVSMIIFGEILEEKNTKENLKKIYEFLNGWDNSLLINKIIEHKNTEKNKDTEYIR